MSSGKPAGPLRHGWTTGACAAAAAKAAYAALLTGDFPDPVAITLPKGQTPAFALAVHERSADEAMAGIVKDAGDDPDVTHGALVRASVRHGPPGSGVAFVAGEGVGTVTRPGLPLPVGEPAINPAPRAMIRQAVAESAAAHGGSGDVVVTISVPGGEALARKTLNPRLGVVGGLSILGTSGIVVPFSCSAWIHSIHRGIDVARAAGLAHVAGATGAVSEEAVARLHGLPEIALIDMGDFVGGMLKYIRKHPIGRVTVAGGFAKMTKLAQGFLDLHSRSGAVDFRWLAERVEALGGEAETVAAVAQANTAVDALEIAARAGLALAPAVAAEGWTTAARVLAGTGIGLDIAVFDREGGLLARTAERTAA
ncbi:cobalt-precorrin-5B (C(1))-methyltransferase [Labrys wisconsinensis]|uniref:Cobalt-precorrin-5B C(1)-methyltransferase n=1 Tax=Labrys wisconsinensis TaxID=425677 RepID=A0ABU0IZB2_9HYPH|nr:cobalt-precorrin-5B (C(1))-methyltransferase [Labrys wisconsinensis]MDQ0467351.1 cobalt-precorrin-5B (C1)-methyltransferase [Labrys wisconsinensis]